MSGRARNTQLDLGSSACLAPDVEVRVRQRISVWLMKDGGAIISHRRDPNNRLAQAFGCVVILCQVVLSEIAGAKLEPPKSLRTDSQSKGIMTLSRSRPDWPARSIGITTHLTRYRRCLLRPNPAAKWTQTSFTQNSPQDRQSRLRKDLLN